MCFMYTVQAYAVWSQLKSHFPYRGGSILTLRACVIVCVERISSPFLYFCSVLQQPHKKYHQQNRPLPLSSCFSIHFGMTLFFTTGKPYCYFKARKCTPLRKGIPKDD